MNRQSQWLFEAPPVLEVTHYTNPYANSEYYSDRELTGECEDRTPECPPSGVSGETVSGYITHDTKVPRREKEKIKAIADRLVKGAKGGSPSIRVCIIGHADQDLKKGERFERDISHKRAVEVMNALKDAISDASISSKVTFKLVCAGKDNPIVAFNKPLSQRERNRRVEIFVNIAPTPPPPRKEEPPRTQPEIRPSRPGERPLLCRDGKIFCATSEFIRSTSRFCNLSAEATEKAIDIEFQSILDSPKILVPDINPKIAIERRQAFRRLAKERVEAFVNSCFDIRGSRSVVPRRRTKPFTRT